MGKQSSQVAEYEQLALTQSSRLASLTWAGEALIVLQTSSVHLDFVRRYDIVDVTPSSSLLAVH